MLITLYSSKATQLSMAHHLARVLRETHAQTSWSESPSVSQNKLKQIGGRPLDLWAKTYIASALIFHRSSHWIGCVGKIHQELMEFLAQKYVSVFHVLPFFMSVKNMRISHKFPMNFPWKSFHCRSSTIASSSSACRGLSLWAAPGASPTLQGQLGPSTGEAWNVWKPTVWLSGYWMINWRG